MEECCCADALEPIAIESCPPRVLPAVGAVILAPLPMAIELRAAAFAVEPNATAFS